MSKKRKRNEDGSFIVELEHPVEHAGKSIDRIVLRGEATVADLEAMDGAKGEIGKTINLVAELSGVSKLVIRKMRPSDYQVVAEVVADILGNELQGIGET
jgi:hypothetical protein